MSKSQQNKWTKTTERAPNFEGTEVGKLLENLKKLQSHYEGDLQKDLGHLAVLQQALGKLEAQKRNRKVDPNG
jgi:hypothetical protein